MQDFIILECIIYDKRLHLLALGFVEMFENVMHAHMVPPGLLITVTFDKKNRKKDLQDRKLIEPQALEINKEMYLAIRRWNMQVVYYYRNTI